jgi:4,5-dihydroxyphthalate decarboxylase
MSSPPLVLATRDWDHVVPLRTGEVTSARAQLRLLVRAVTPNVVDEPELDGGEISFSRYVLGMLAGDDRLVGTPVFVMRGFRQRCALVREGSGLRELTQLSGCRVGLTGWPDSGNTWTRAAIRSAGADLDSITWLVGDLTGGVVDPHRLGSEPLPANVEVLPGGTSLTAALRAGDLDAILTPFMPPGFFAGDSGLRHLLGDHRRAEREWFRRTGYVPGIHIVALRRERVRRHPWLPDEVIELFERSKQSWWSRRRHLADTTPWLLADLEDAAATFGGDWMPYGLPANRTMIEDFATELYRQGIADRIASADELFPLGGPTSDALEDSA